MFKSFRVLTPVLAVLAAWVFLIVLVSALGRSRGMAPWNSPAQQMHVLTFPTAEGVTEEGLAAMGGRRITYRVPGQYPSKNVLSFYQRDLRARGWRQLGEENPAWQSRQRGDTLSHTLFASWVNPTGLDEFQLTLTAKEKLVRDSRGNWARAGQPEPDMQVLCVVTRHFPEPKMKREPESPLTAP